MKQNLLKITKFMAVCAILILSSCEKELYEEQIYSEKEKITIKTLNDLPFLKNTIQSKIANKGTNNKDIDYLQLIDESKILVIEDDNNLKTYNFSLKLDNSIRLLNLSIKEISPDAYKYYLIKYTANNYEEWLLDIKENNFSNITPQIEVSELGKISGCTESVITFTCPSGMHHYGQQNACDFTFESWTTSYNISWVPCPGVEGNLNEGGGGTTSTAVLTSIPNVYHGTLLNVNDKTPCESLNDLNYQTENNAHNASQAIKTTNELAVGYDGEQGALFINNNGNLSTSQLNPSLANNSTSYGININVGSNIYGAVHSHQDNASQTPMFSFNDVLKLYNLYTNTDPLNRADVVFVLTLPNGQTYAIKVNNISSLKNFLNSYFTRKEINEEPDQKKRFKKMNSIFDDRNCSSCTQSTPDLADKYKLGFLNEMRQSGVSLYQSTDSNYTQWKELRAPLNLNGSVPIEIPCPN